MFLTAVVVSVASSSTKYSIFLPAISLGSSVNVFFSGMPSEAAGPVADTVTPTLTWALAAPANRLAAARAITLARLNVISSPSVPKRKKASAGFRPADALSSWFGPFFGLYGRRSAGAGVNVGNFEDRPVCFSRPARLTPGLRSGIHRPCGRECESSLTQRFRTKRRD
ncbi:hypothetical protein D3C81_1736960 [compost metagenome]